MAQSMQWSATSRDVSDLILDLIGANIVFFDLSRNRQG